MGPTAVKFGVETEVAALSAGVDNTSSPSEVS